MKFVDVIVKLGDETNHVYKASLPLEIGRMDHGEELLRTQNVGNGNFRLAVAPIDMIGVSRRSMRVEDNGDGGLRLVNIHSTNSFQVSDENLVVGPGQSLSVSGNVTVKLPQQLMLTFTLKSMNAPVEYDRSMRTLEAVESSMTNGTQDARLGQLKNETSDKNPAAVAVSLVRQALTVVQKAAGSNEFFEAAVRAVANMIELDRAYVILFESDHWTVRSMFSFESDSSINFTDSKTIEPLPSGSTRLLDNVLQTKKTVIYEPDSYLQTAGSSMISLDRAVAAPMFNKAGEVIGVVYGDRRVVDDRSNEPIGELEATLLEVMASAVASGLARQHEESLRASLTQFFSPAVTDRLEKNENLLLGRDAEVTVLFCDIRGFSAVSKRVGPARTIEWINDVMTELSQCVIETDGVLVDYIGDELMAMWGAPAQQPDHALRACRTASLMLKQIEPLRQKWSDITSDQFGFGIGINTGVAQVGNTGSKVKFKYGPLGNTVNVASRVQGMTKAFGVRVLLTSSTLDEVTKCQGAASEIVLQTRHLADAKPLGINEVVTLYELNPDADPNWQQLRLSYEKALDCYHKSDLAGAAKELASLVYKNANDTPSVLLLGRVVDALTHKKTVVDPVFVFDHK